MKGKRYVEALTAPKASDLAKELDYFTNFDHITCCVEALKFYGVDCDGDVLKILAS